MSELNDLRKDFLNSIEDSRVKDQWKAKPAKATEKQVAYLNNLRLNLVSYANLHRWRKVADWMAVNPVPETAGAAGGQIDLFVNLGGFKIHNITEEMLMGVLRAYSDKES